MTTQVREEKPYFGNVAVSTAVRRQGVGEKLVKIGVKLVENKWKDDCVFVAVGMALILLIPKIIYHR